MKHIARKRFGQHFLSDGGIIDAIVREIAPVPGEPMVEIGPGLAALTQPLVERLGRLTVIELDRDLAARLRQHPQLQVIESDVLKVDFTLVIGLAFTWLTNALVTVPLYFGFYLTGQLLQRGPDGLLSFTHFRAAFATLEAGDLPWREKLMHALGDWGVTLWLGALPWAVVMAGFGYVAATSYLRHRKPLRRKA